MKKCIQINRLEFRIYQWLFEHFVYCIKGRENYETSIEKTSISSLKHCHIIYWYILGGVFGGWRLIEAGDIIGIEFAVACIVGFIMYIVVGIAVALKKNIAELEKRVMELEGKKKEV